MTKAPTAQITMAFVSFDIGGAFEMGIARGIERACQQRKWAMQVYDSGSDPQLEDRNLSRLAESGARGALIVPLGGHANIESLIKLKLAKFPFVLLDRPLPGVGVDVVRSDHHKGAYLATEHLIEQGHTRVFMLSEPPACLPIEARIRGYEQALLDHGIEPLRQWRVNVDPQDSKQGVQEERRWLGGYRAALPVLKELDLPAAFFTLNDYIGWGLYEACRELGLRIPADVSIVCFDDSDVTRAMNPQMTCVAQRTFELGQEAVGLLERRLQAGSLDSDPPRQVVTDVDLIKRDSVAPGPGPRL